MTRVHRWLFASGSSQRLAALRIGLFAVIAVRLTNPVYLDLTEQPRALFEPLSFMHLFDQMPARGVVIPVQVIGLSAAVLAVAGWRARATVPLAWLALAFLGGMNTSLGKVQHNDVLVLLCAMPLLIAPCADAWSLDARRRGASAASAGQAARARPSALYGWPVNTAIVVVAGAYVFAGLQKMISAGPAWITSDNMRWILYASSDSQPTPNTLALFIADRPLLAHALAAATIALELAFIAVIWSTRSRPYAVAAAAALHLGIWATMRLDYRPQVAAVAIVLIDWPTILTRARRRLST